MNINCRATGFEITGAIDMFLREQLSSALQRFSDNVVEVDVFMKDANGPKGGVDKHVLIRVRLRNRHRIVLEVVHENLYAAIKIGARKTRRAVRRRLRRSGRILRRRWEHYAT
ncbi:MAG: HPF/RaiA family ribosome-associated protein [Woeseiaceae bacterium]|nr:HPF/RaiA family ribosome-associated protein [Woeseiaceae bacterium]